MQKLQVIADRLLVLPEKAETHRKSGIILPSSAAKDLPENKNSRGVVIDRGGGTPNNPMDEFKQNGKEIVLFPSGAGIAVEVENHIGDKVEYRILKFDEIIGIL